MQIYCRAYVATSARRGLGKMLMSSLELVFWWSWIILIDKSKHAHGKLSGWGGTPPGDEAGTAGRRAENVLVELVDQLIVRLINCVLGASPLAVESTPPTTY